MSRSALTPTNVPSGASDPTFPTLKAGDLFWRSDLKVLRQYDGSGWLTIGPNEICQTFGIPGTLATQVGKSGFYLPYAATMVTCWAGVDTAPTGAAVIVDVNKNGTTVFSTQSNRPTIAVSTTFSGLVTNMNTTAFAASDKCTVDLDQVGSTVAGADLTVGVLWRKIG